MKTMNNIYIPSIAEGLREYYMDLNTPEALEDLIIEAREAVEEAGQGFYNIPYRLDLALIREGAVWDLGESWNMDCYYFWQHQVGQVSIHDPNQMVEWGPEARAGINRIPQEWAGVPRQEYALELLSDREWRQKMAAATDIRKSWLQRLPDIRFFYFNADEEGNLFRQEEYEEEAAA